MFLKISLVIIIICLIILMVFVQKIYSKLGKIHYIISTNDLELERINKLLIGEKSAFVKMQNKIEGIHASISMQLVKKIIQSKNK